MSTPVEIVREFQKWRRGGMRVEGTGEECPPYPEMPSTPEVYGKALDELIVTAERYQTLQEAGYLDITVLAAKPAMNKFVGRRQGETQHLTARSLNGLADVLRGNP